MKNNRPFDPSMFKAAIALAILVIVAAVGGVLSIPRSTTPSRIENFLGDTPIAQSQVALDVTGSWSTEIGDKFPMNAKISGDTIEIEMGVDGSTMSYWYGTFSNSAANGAGIESISKEHPTKTFLSSAKSKPFVYRDDKISFEYSGMGITKTIELIRV